MSFRLIFLYIDLWSIQKLSFLNAHVKHLNRVRIFISTLKYGASLNAQCYLWKLYTYMVPIMRENDKKKHKISCIEAQYLKYIHHYKSSNWCRSSIKYCTQPVSQEALSVFTKGLSDLVKLLTSGTMILLNPASEDHKFSIFSLNRHCLWSSLSLSSLLVSSGIQKKFEELLSKGNNTWTIMSRHSGYSSEKNHLNSFWLPWKKKKRKGFSF